jgi:putative membrane protein
VRRGERGFRCSIALNGLPSDQLHDDATRRTRLANERTFLAWWRTALAAIGLAVAVGKVLPELLDEERWPYALLGLVLAGLGVCVAAVGWWRYRTLDRSLGGAEEARTPDFVLAALTVCLVGVGISIGLVVALSG